MSLDPEPGWQLRHKIGDRGRQLLKVSCRSSRMVFQRSTEMEKANSYSWLWWNSPKSVAKTKFYKSTMTVWRSSEPVWLRRSVVLTSLQPWLTRLLRISYPFLSPKSKKWTREPKKYRWKPWYRCSTTLRQTFISFSNNCWVFFERMPWERICQPTNRHPELSQQELKFA